MGSQDLQTGRFDQLIRRVGGLYGGGSKVVEVLPELFPILETENTTPELLALSGWRVAWQSTDRPASVGDLNQHQLFNPVGSGQIIAITQFAISSTTNPAVQAEVTATQTGGGVRGLFRDGRFGVPRSTVAVLQSNDGGVTGGGYRARLNATEIITVRDDNGIVVLSPGTGLNIGSTATNVQLLVMWYWRERLALDSEINFP